MSHMTKLEERISEFVDFSGCVSGDCDHVKWAECAEAYKIRIKEFILELPELEYIKRLEAENTKLRDALDFYARFNLWEYRDRKGLMVRLGEENKPFEPVHERAKAVLEKIREAMK